MRKEIMTKVKSLPVNQMFITHYHEDHTGNIVALQKLFECPVYSSELCRDLMNTPPKTSLVQKLQWGDRPAFRNLSPILGAIKTSQFEFQIIAIPGHAPDMLALFEPEKKWLFSADLYLHYYIGYFLKEESMLDQINSIQKVLQLDFEVLFCSHNPQLTMGKKNLEKKLHYLQKFYDNVTQLYEKGYQAKEIFTKLKLKEHRVMKLLSGGNLSRLNMVKSVIRDIEKSGHK